MSRALRVAIVVSIIKMVTDASFATPVLPCRKEAKLADRQFETSSLRVAGVSKRYVTAAARLKCRSSSNN